MPRHASRLRSLVLALCIPLCASAFAQTRPAKLPPPDAAAQAKSLALIRNLFKDEYAKKSATDRVALAARLYKEALATQDDLNARYMLLLESQDLASGGGDAEQALRSIDDLSTTHVIDALDLKHKALLRCALLPLTPTAAETLTKLSLDVADLAVIVDSFDIVTSLANLAESSANKTKRVAFVASIQPRLTDLRANAADYAKVQIARGKLHADPDDADAHLLIGRFYCFNKGDFATGLPQLARGSDGTLKALAQRDTASPREALAQVEMGDAWWDYAQLTGGYVKLRCTQRAQHWYKIAGDNITGITLTRIQSRLKNTGTSPSTASATQAKSTDPVTPTSPAGTNLLALLDLAKDSVSGKWQTESSAVTTDSSKYSRLEIPLIPPDEYDFRVTFTRTDGDGYIAILLQSHGNAFGLALDVKGEARFERVQNKIKEGNPTTVPILVQNGKKNTVLIQVRKDKVIAIFNDKPLVEWKTDGKDLTRYTLWKLNDEKLLGLGAHNAKVTFHSAELIPVSGKAKPVR